ncbi:leucine-rich repeat extensin-like protein 3 isoform X2 [Zingiber officinale]|uniref:leucine-rich repeat extensin-like protein 3 isoform X2 n=1 Tax=Zingiber officinale TaxID=94328 RepID=UPI001C4B2CF7|nr:leucine-rich repeat extensin-like protein 3 isoform X2 [Zingiber officinale]
MKTTRGKGTLPLPSFLSPSSSNSKFSIFFLSRISTSRHGGDQKSEAQGWHFPFPSHRQCKFPPLEPPSLPFPEQLNRPKHAQSPTPPTAILAASAPSSPASPSTVACWKLFASSNGSRPPPSTPTSSPSPMRSRSPPISARWTREGRSKLSSSRRIYPWTSPPPTRSSISTSSAAASPTRRRCSTVMHAVHRCHTHLGT